MGDVTIRVAFTHDEADALAQLVKRIGRYDVAHLAGSASEADLMFEALILVRQALAEAGVAPR